MPGYSMKVISPILPKIGCHGNVPWGIKILARIDNIHANTFHLVKKQIVKIGPVDAEIALLNLKKEMEGKTYSPVGQVCQAG